MYLIIEKKGIYVIRYQFWKIIVSRWDISIANKFLQVSRPNACIFEDLEDFKLQNSAFDWNFSS